MENMFAWLVAWNYLAKYTPRKRQIKMQRNFYAPKSPN